MKTAKKILCILLALAMVLSMAGCTAGESSPEPPSEAAADPAEAPQQESSSDTITIVDFNDREVEVPRDVQRIVAGWGIKNYICMDVDDKIVNSTTDDFCLMINPDLANRGSIKRDGTTSAEAIADLEPDVVIMKWNSKLIDTLDELGIPTLALRMETEEEVLYAIDMFGKAFGKEERAKELIDYYEKLTGMAEDLVADIPDSEKPTAIFLGEYVGSTAPDTMLQGMALEKAGAVNPAAAVGRGELWAQVGMEQIMEWDPDYIFMANDLTSRDYTLESFINDPANASLKAVQNGHVYESPADIDLWMYPGFVISLGTLWLIHTMYPDRLSDAELEEIALEYYDTVYGLTLTREELGF
ncbi:ABC transporter substrate-binding protein [uncultured Dysosmobacter sp.]|uniref:ABC transporter substrate-binding protein n=1 Tax=uncultured Dysosmobacter sp. TaxID=2591384 RepID=UPI0026244F5A|nr:ABC transporter substrate-binding protein [uncultured Dysosmobacter sp.]